MTVLLTRVRSAAEKRRVAEGAYRAAITKARRVHTLEEVAAAAGVTRQAVASLLKTLDRTSGPHGKGKR